MLSMIIVIYLLFVVVHSKLTHSYVVMTSNTVLTKHIKLIMEQSYYKDKDKIKIFYFRSKRPID